MMDKTSVNSALLDLDSLFGLLQQHPAGLSEFELMKICDDHLPTNENPEVELFTRHFLLFNALYRLREKLAKESNMVLHISALEIRLGEKNTDSTLPDIDDGLTRYYLDLTQLEKANPEYVNQLLDTFWVRYYRLEDRDKALETLGLDENADETTIRNRYRKLMMEHHPDRGGNAENMMYFRQAAEQLGIFDRNNTRQKPDK